MNIAEVALAAGVSNATVSRALSGRGSVSPQTRERVLQAAADLGYVVSQAASTLASGRNRNVGLVLPFLDKWFFTQVLAGAQERLMRAGYDVTLYNLAGRGFERREVFENFLLRRRVDAVIAVSLELTDDEIERLHELDKPLVGVGCRSRAYARSPSTMCSRLAWPRSTCWGWATPASRTSAETMPAMSTSTCRPSAARATRRRSSPRE